MRGWRALVAVAVLLFSCGAVAVAAEESEQRAEPDILNALNQPFVGDLPALVERRLVRILTVHNKTNYFLDGAQQRGVTYEVAKAFEEFLNKDQKINKRRPLSIAFVPVHRDQLIPMLLSGHGDIIAANLTITPDRAALVDFADPLASGVREILVTGPAAPEIATLDALAGQRIHVRLSSSYYESLRGFNAVLEAKGLAPMQLEPADETLEDEDLLEMVSAGILAFAVVDEHKAKLWVDILPDLVLRDDLVFRADGAIAWAVRPGSPDLLAAINRFVPKAKQGTELGNTLIRRYFKANKWITNPAATTDRKRFDEALPLFRTYAAQYGFDWLMVAAQAYQESRIDQSVKSPVGAVGIMQIKPETAADKSVGIPDISTMEPNIHAGVRYLRWIMDTYLDDPAIDDKNRLFLAFAGYNAGPGRLNGLREKTAADGLDPNQWFGNVEHAAAAKIGRETVTYVMNIAKYYFAYRMILENEAAGQDIQP